MSRIAALAVAALAAASCASQPRSAAPAGHRPASHRPAPHPRVSWHVLAGAKRFPVLTGGPVPWLAATAPPPAAAIAPGIHPCSPQQLTAKIPAMQGATMGQMAGVIHLTSTGTHPCTLRGYPAVRLLSPAGTVIPAPESRGHRLNPRPLTWPRIVIHPGATAWVNVISSNWCGPRPAAWQLVLPGTGALVIRHGWRMGICEFRSGPSDLSVGPVEPAQAGPKWPLVPMIFGWPLHGNAGGSLAYVVFLMNAQTDSYRFPQSCPTYVERLAAGKRLIAAERHLLNCAHLGAIPGNVAAAFTIRMQIPPGAAGKATLTWALDPPFGFSRSVPAVISR
ncbi:MAG TPA: DUF4232 domain-containing protein [Streptosporangiaceae bacterium]